MRKEEFIKNLMDFNFKDKGVIDELEKIMKEFFEGNKTMIEFNYIPEIAIQKAIGNIYPGFDYEVKNTAERDFLYYFAYNGKRYVYEGCSFYGTGSLKISPQLPHC